MPSMRSAPNATNVGKPPVKRGRRRNRPLDCWPYQVSKVVKKKTHEVFGISNTVLLDSYVDRGALDAHLGNLLERPVHVALRGESKCGKSWVRQKVIANAIVVQCRLHKSVIDIYVDALSQLDVRLEIEKSVDRKINGRVEAGGAFGLKLLGEVGLKASVDVEAKGSTKRARVGHTITDLRFVADIIKASGRRLVIEDFHYLSVEERKVFAFDLKAFWDYGLFVVVVGVWSQNNMLLELNADLAGRVQEEPIYWSDADLEKVILKGGWALNLDFSRKFRDKIVSICFGNVGVLQTLLIKALDELSIRETCEATKEVEDLVAIESAAMQYAEQLNPLYQSFARRVADGIRNRADSTGIYAHAMAVVLAQTDTLLMTGVNIDTIFDVAHARQPRIQKGNLRTVLSNFERLQVDEEGRGLVLAYNESDGDVSVVDRQLLLYRKYSTVKWPWEDLIADARERSSALPAALPAQLILPPPDRTEPDGSGEGF